jgi:hypothetical protein
VNQREQVAAAQSAQSPLWMPQIVQSVNVLAENLLTFTKSSTIVWKKWSSLDSNKQLSSVESTLHTYNEYECHGTTSNRYGECESVEVINAIIETYRGICHWPSWPHSELPCSLRMSISHPLLTTRHNITLQGCPKYQTKIYERRTALKNQLGNNVNSTNPRSDYNSIHALFVSMHKLNA